MSGNTESIVNLHPTLILGMHRCGTSALTRVLNLIGLDLVKDLVAPNKYNPLGYWEPKAIVHCNDRLLAAFDRNWADPKPMPQDWAATADAHRSGGEVAALLNAEYNGLGNAVIKDPRLSRVMPVWRMALTHCGDPGPACLIVCRNPLEVCQSLKLRDGLSLDHGLSLWLTYMLEAEFGTRGLPRAVVHYENLLNDWRATLQSAFAAMELPLPQSNATIAGQIDGFLDHNHRHHASTPADLMAHPEIDDVVKDVYRLFLHDMRLEKRAEFDLSHHRWQSAWAATSPGRQGSPLAQTIPEWHLERSSRLEKAGNIDAALAAARSAADLRPDGAWLHHRLGKLLVKAGRIEDAEVAYRQAVALNDGSPWFHDALSQVLAQLGRTDEAIEVARQAVQRGPGIAQLHHRLGNLLAAADRFEDAEAAHRRAVALNDGAPWLHIALSGALVQLGRTDEAIEVAEQAVQRGPGIAQLHHRLGNLLATAGRFEDAEAAHCRTIALDRNSLGFDRGATGAEEPDANHPTIHHLCRLLALMAAKWWATDIECLLRQGADAPSDDPEWPLGKKIPRCQDVPLQPRSAAGVGPQLSIMIPVYNIENERWLQQCIESVLNQDRGRGWAEIVVVDDASSNSSARRIAEKYEHRVTYRCNSNNMGLIGNHNQCIASAAGEFVHILHQDDHIEPGFYDALLAPMLRDRSLVAAYANHRSINVNRRHSHRAALLRPQAGPLENWLARLAQQQVFQFCAMIVRRSTYVAAGGFSPSLIYAFDWEMWGRVTALGPIWYEPGCLANFRVHQQSATHGIAPVDRLVDSMQTVLRMLLALPADVRRPIARVAFTHFFPRYWAMVAGRPETVTAGERQDLRDFLMKPWQNDKDRPQLEAALQRFTPV
jgi:tetratricopeptide (TPR) repeat protein